MLLLPMPGRTLTTLGDYLDRRHIIHAYCTRAFLPPGCEGTWRGVELDLAALAAQYGRDTPLAAIKERLRCRLCGAPGTIRIGHDGRPSR